MDLKPENDKLVFTFDADRLNLIGSIETDHLGTIPIGSKTPFLIKYDSTVEEKHLIFEKKGTSYYVINKSTYGSYYRIKPNICTTVPFNVYVIIGKTWLYATKEKEEKCLLLFFNENYKSIMPPQLIDSKKEVIIGKSLGDITISGDSSMSKMHLRLKANEKDISIMDWRSGTGSKNGTWVQFQAGEIVGNVVDFRIGMQTFFRFTKGNRCPKSNMLSFAPQYVNPNESNIIS